MNSRAGGVSGLWEEARPLAAGRVEPSSRQAWLSPQGLSRRAAGLGLHISAVIPTHNSSSESLGAIETVWSVILGLAAYLKQKVLWPFLQFTLLLPSWLLTAFLSPQCRVLKPLSSLASYPPSTPHCFLKRIPQILLSVTENHCAFSRPYSQIHSLRPSLHVQLPPRCSDEHTSSDPSPSTGEPRPPWLAPHPQEAVGMFAGQVRLLLRALLPLRTFVPHFH